MSERSDDAGIVLADLVEIKEALAEIVRLLRIVALESPSTGWSESVSSRDDSQKA